MSQNQFKIGQLFSPQGKKNMNVGLKGIFHFQLQTFTSPTTNFLVKYLILFYILKILKCY